MLKPLAAFVFILILITQIAGCNTNGGIVPAGPSNGVPPTTSSSPSASPSSSPNERIRRDTCNLRACIVAHFVEPGPHDRRD
jgi:hypothetical protein